MLSQSSLSQPPLQPTLHDPAPSHPYSPQPASGSVPGAWLKQVPTDSDSMQDWQGPLQPVLQQTPSAQAPEVH
jgi:hypothetical protein